jgi:hypothetical protein
MQESREELQLKVEQDGRKLEPSFGHMGPDYCPTQPTSGSLDQVHVHGFFCIQLAFFFFGLGQAPILRMRLTNESD